MPNPKPSRTHRVIVTVTFDKPCNKGEATSIVRDGLHGNYWRLDTDNGERFTVTRVQQATGD